MSARLLAAGENLATVLAAENVALVAGDLAGAGRMLAAKTQALAAFEAAQGAKLSTNDMPHAAALARRITALAGENQRLLERALAVQGRVLEVIARAAPAAPGNFYRAAGRRGSASRPPPVAVRANA